MYISKLFNILGDDYAIHQIIQSLFEGQRTLFQNCGGCITILSTNPPTNSKYQIETRKVVIPEQEGSVHLFSCRLNPIKRCKNTTKRIGLWENELDKWIRRKSIENGFSILDMKLSDEGHRISKKGISTISLRSIMLMGILSITEAEKFKKAVQFGIGSAKGLGFGLINLF